MGVLHPVVRRLGAARVARQAVRLTQEKDAAALDTLAAACAESGEFPRALATAERALTLAATANQASLRERIQARQALYRAGRPWRE